MEEQPIKVFFCHLRTNRPGAITVAYKALGAHIEAGFAFCSLNDNFSRAIGRNIAKGRLEKNPVRIDDVHFNEHKKLEISKTLIEFLHNLLAKEVADIKPVETSLHIKMWADVEEVDNYQGDFLVWFCDFVKKLRFDLEKRKS
jgi:hypothetical protein